MAVRDGPKAAAQFGWVRWFLTDVIGLKRIGVVRADGVSGHKSSKRVQCGEPNKTHKIG